MIPLRDSSTKRRFTPINTLLILANLAVFAYEFSLGPRVEAFVRRYAMIPGQVGASLEWSHWGAGPDAASPGLRPILTLVTSMFVHGGIVHVAGNINEANDVFARSLPLPPLAEGDLLALYPAGAYGASMASDHCLRGLPAEVLL